MKQFLAIFLGSPEALSAWRAQDDAAQKERQKQGMEAWMQWTIDNKNSIVQDGSPIGKTKRVNKEGISDIKNEIGAYLVVQAESHEEASKLFLNHPHFTIFPGDRVEVMECLPIPTM